MLKNLKGRKIAIFYRKFSSTIEKKSSFRKKLNFPTSESTINERDEKIMRCLR